MLGMVEIVHQFGQKTGFQQPDMEAAINNYEILLIESGLSEKAAIKHVRDVLGVDSS